VQIEHAAGACVVHLIGALDASDVPAFNRQVAPLVDAGEAPVVFELSRAEMVDSTMLGALIGWRRHADAQGRPPVLFVSGDSPAARLLSVVIGGLVELYDDLDDALAAHA
jgi:anti-anti-sigma factor